MKIKQIIAIILAGVGMLSAGAAETLATPLLVEQGVFGVIGAFNIPFSGGFDDRATFSGDGFAASDLGNESNFFDAVFVTGVLDVQYGLGNLGNHGTIQVGDVSCQIHLDATGATCGATLNFVHTPLPVDTLDRVEAPFTMTGQLVLGQVGLPNLIVDIEGSGIVTGRAHNFDPGTTYEAGYAFAVPEPSSALLLFTGISAVLVARRKRASAGLRDRV